MELEPYARPHPPKFLNVEHVPCTLLAHPEIYLQHQWTALVLWPSCCLPPQLLKLQHLCLRAFSGHNNHERSGSADQLTPREILPAGERPPGLVVKYPHLPS